MRKVSDTISRLAALRASASLGFSQPTQDRLSELACFGSNPGNLAALTYVPPRLAERAPLVVVLHGCTQSAAAYDHGSGWSQLADEAGFALLFPEQRRVNNANLCFNWFVPGDTRRDVGEALSIRQMVESMILAHGLDRRRIFITGLSAGGAMTSVMLATYPEIFSGGAIIAGLPYGTAGTIPQAFDRMRGHGGPAPRQLEQLVRDASSHKGPWPTISVWHGTADATVSASNAKDIVEQWRGIHAVTGETAQTSSVEGQSRQAWSDRAGREVIEEYSITGMGHGTPIAAAGKRALGNAGPFMLDTGISSTRYIAGFWGIAAGAKKAAAKAEETIEVEPTPSRGPISTRAIERREAKKAERQPGAGTSDPTGVRKIIEDALRAAGLMR